MHLHLQHLMRYVKDNTAMRYSISIRADMVRLTDCRIMQRDATRRDDNDDVRTFLDDRILR